MDGVVHDHVADIQQAFFGGISGVQAVGHGVNDDDFFAVAFKRIGL